MKYLLCFSFALLFLNCNSTKTVAHTPDQHIEIPKKLVIFMDGTMNNPSSYTNVSKLYSLSILQDRKNVSATYIVGVGNKGFGFITGMGIGSTVKDGYLFLSKNYKPERGDEIFIFGFSRGAYASRILAGLIHVAGITDLSDIAEKDQKKHIKKIYRAFKGDQTIYNRRKAITAITGEIPTSVAVEFMGLWDTVESLGIPNFKENYNVTNKKYVDQLCNIKRASHAMSINDDRATIFTPKLLTETYLTSKCEKPVNIDAIVNEVWFAGAHADVGGGYGDTEIDAVSLNWMLSEIAPYSLVPEDTDVYENSNGIIHDPDNGTMEFLYKSNYRNIAVYQENSTYNNGKLKVYPTAFKRLIHPDNLPLVAYEHVLQEQFPKCFEKQENGTFIFIEGEKCKLEIYSEE